MSSSDAPCQQGATGGNIARQTVLRAGFPVTRRRHDGRSLLLLGLADDRDGRAAHHRMTACSIAAAGGVESIACVQNDHAEQLPQCATRRSSPQARALLADARDRGGGRRALQDFARGAGRVRAREPAAHRGGAAGADVRRRDRADRRPRWCVTDKATGATRNEKVTLHRTRATGPTRRSKGSRRSSPCARDGKTSPPATRASFPTAPRSAS